MSTSQTWPGGATDATPTVYSIPASGELNWASLSDFLNAIASGSQSTTLQKFAVRKATSSPVTVSATTDCVVVTDLSSAGAVTVNLPAGANKQVFIVVDGKGDAAKNNITINRSGSDTIAGSTTAVLSTNREGIALIYNASDTDWKIIGRFRSNSGETVENHQTGANQVNIAASGDTVNVFTAASSNGTTSISLTAGDWMVSGQVNFSQNSSTVTTARLASISKTSGATPAGTTLANRSGNGESYTQSQTRIDGAVSGAVDHVELISPIKVSLTTTTPIYLTAKAVFTGGGASVNVSGSIFAVRIR